MLDRYLLEKISIDEVIFFEWLILKKASFGNSKFFYQQNRLMNELGIKRSRLETIKGRFIDEYGLIIEKEGFNNVTHFTVNEAFIKAYTGDNIKKSFQKDHLKNLLSFKINSTKQKAAIAPGYIESLIEDLTEIYNQSRERQNSKNSNEQLTRTELPFNKKTKEQLAELASNYEEHTIKYAFQAYSEAITNKEDYSNHLLNNFSSYDKEKESFGVFTRYLEKFNREYSIKN